MMLLMVGFFSCLGAKLCALYFFQYMLPKLKTTYKFDNHTSTNENLKEVVEENQFFVENIEVERLNYDINPQEVNLASRQRYLEALVQVEHALLSFDGSTQYYKEILQILGQACQVSQVYVCENFRSSNGDLMMSQKAEWLTSDILGKSSKPGLDELCYEEFFPRWVEILTKGGIVSGIVKEFPQLEHQILDPQGVLSILVLPIIAKGEFFGFIRFDDCLEERIWDVAEIKFLQAAAGAISLAHERLSAEDALRTVITETRNFASQLEGKVQERTAELEKEITERKRVQVELEKSLSLQRATLESTADGILVVDSRGNIAGFNQKFVQMWGIPESLMTAKRYVKVLKFAMSKLQEPKNYLATVRETHAYPGAQVYDFISFKDGRVFERYSQPQRIGGTIVGRVWSFRDVTAQKSAEAKIRHQALHDLLTDLPNRVLFNERLSEALATANEKQGQLAVCFLDLDRFKTINDTLGHAVGDKLLQSVAQRLTNCLKEYDTIARWGGDEFTVILPEITDASDAGRVTQEILDALKPSFEIDNHHLHISASIGIALYPMHGGDAETLIKHADAALYRAKSEGKNKYQFYNSTITEQVSELLILENSLHHALKEQQFKIHYQPQVNISTGEIKKMEALIRWQHPKLGLISPGKFIPLAEETGLIINIGEWILRTACAQTKAWQEELDLPSLSIAVNLSARQLQQPNLVRMVKQVLSETKLAPECLELEITESVAMQNIDLSKSVLSELHQMGISISIDDFGTGYCSLSYIKNFPIHTLKIDKSFVQDLSNDANNAAIITAIIALAHRLNLAVVAEGVETEEERNSLRNLECELMQGFLFSKPIPSNDAIVLLRKSKSRRIKTSCLVA
ncbi:MAG: EAL domain-containing protein [Scytonematopsis contorta HA4267-MV1]|jgi:diguanylate cyclase (GGDEF)-like protein/PAS domain S-box-containing protein|nr:EAL domain-containing protein [Scytonematopsis contorta HA4267-MV1]